MNRAWTQFAVSFVGITGLVVVLLVSILSGQAKEFITLLAGGLLSLSSMSAAYLFRLNGNNKG